MELATSNVHRNLDAKIKVLGFELFDLLSVLILAATMNLIFGGTSLSLLMVFILPGVAAVTLYFGKRGKPDSFLIHFVRYLLLSGVFAPGNSPTSEVKMKEKIYVK